MSAAITTTLDLLSANHRRAGQPAIVCRDRVLSYNELTTCVNNFSGFLAQRNLYRGDRAVLAISSKVDYLVAILAVMNIGGVAVPCGTDISIDDRVLIARDVAPRIMIMDIGTYRSHSWESDDQFGDTESFVILGNDCQGNLAATETRRTVFFDPSHMVDHSKLANRERVSPLDAALIMYTSGTGGERKGVLLSHNNLIQTSKNINEFMQVDESIREYVALPLSHSFGFGRVRCVLLAGGTLVFDDGMFNPARMTRDFKKHNCNAVSGVPAVFAMLLGRFEHMLAEIGPAVRHIEIGSAPMPMEHKMRLMNTCPNARICMHYGLTEGSRSTFIEFHSEKDRLDTVGKAAPNTLVTIVDDEGNEVEYGVEGEITVSGDNVAMGYWNRADLTQQRFSGQWFRTGDCGTMSEDGYVKFLGRKDDVINVGGDKVIPLEVESVIRQLYPGLELCVLGIPDPNGILGEVVALTYRRSETGSIHPDDLTRELRHRLEWHKVPKRVIEVEDIPKTQNGKVIRSKLKSMLA